MSFKKIEETKLGKQLWEWLKGRRKVGMEMGVVVETAIKLTEGQKKNLRQILSKKINQEVVVENKINKSIIGGMRLKLKDRLIDASIQSKLDYLQENLLHE